MTTPIIWIPKNLESGFFVLRHFQTVAQLYGLFLGVGAIAILLDDLFAYGGVKVPFNPIQTDTDASDENNSENNPRQDDH